MYVIQLKDGSKEFSYLKDARSYLLLNFFVPEENSWRHIHTGQIVDILLRDEVEEIGS